jgi:acetone carboxylase alpha subunit
MGIGENGKTLKQMLEESEKLFAETGYYCGIKELTLKKQDPLKFERFQGRIIACCIGARDTVRYGCASPGTRELGELIFILFTPEGDSIAHGQGLVSHLVQDTKLCKHVVREDYEANPGIEDGDMFFDNDCYYGGAHTADCRMVMPIFWEGELVGWAGAASHEMDIGAITPGSVPGASVEKFTDGLSIPPSKVGEKDQHRRDFLLRLERGSRSPLLWILDEKAKAAGCIMLRETVKELIKEFGIAYYRQVTREMVEDARWTMRARVKERLVPGRYRAPYFYAEPRAGQRMPPYADKDFYLHLPLEMWVKPDGVLRFDYDGASRWGYHSDNMFGGADHILFCTLTYWFLYDGRANLGSSLVVERNYPWGSVLNPSYRFAGSGFGWGVHNISSNNLCLLLSLGEFARGYVEEVHIVTSIHGGIDVGGVTAEGDVSGTCIFDWSAGGMGGVPIHDGFIGVCPYMPETIWGNCEQWELAAPYYTYLGRNAIADSYGFGKFRGGPGWLVSYRIHNPPEVCILSEGIICGGPKPDEAYGLFGGYPSQGGTQILVQNTNIQELIDKQMPLPREQNGLMHMLKTGVLKAEKVDVRKGFTNSKQVKEGDIYLLFRGGGAGFGDPLEREIEHLKKDLDDGLLTEEKARKVYGAVAHFDPDSSEWSVDTKQTKQLRTEMKNRRKSSGVPVREWWLKEREKVLHKKISEKMLDVYRDCMPRSTKFANEVREFWQLPAEFLF